MRTVKKPEIRKAEILDAAEALFAQKGYSNATINDILALLGISKGVLYHYFASKEDLMQAVVARAIDTEMEAVESLVGDATLSAEDKLRRIIISHEHETPHDGDALPEECQWMNNAEMRLCNIVEMIRRLAPFFTRVVEQGIAEGVFRTPCPKETVEILLIASEFLFDATGTFGGDEAAYLARGKAFAHVMEVALSARPGAFSYIPEWLEDRARNRKRQRAGEKMDEQ